MTDFRVVTPDDMGNSIKLGIKEANKYDVDIAQLDIPEQVTGVSLQGTQLKLETIKGEKTVDLAPLLPKIVADVFLKNAERQEGNIVFTVGNKDNADDDKTFTINIADLASVTPDGEGIVGKGTTDDKLRVNISADTANFTTNLLKQSATGLYVSDTEVKRLITENTPAKEPRGVRLVNASGETVLGYLYATEQ